MGWFALAVIVGALLRVWWTHRPANGPRWTVAVGGVVLVLGFGLATWLALSERAALSEMAATIGTGQTARFLLGLTFGFVTAHGLYGGLITGLNFLSLTLGIGALAIIAPNVDTWLPRLTGFKAAVVEIQLATSARANHKFAVTESMETFVRDTTFAFLAGYPEKIQIDRDYYRNIELAQLIVQSRKEPLSPGGVQKEYRDYVAGIEKIQPVFSQLISPLAYCLKKQIDRGLSVDRLREIMRPHGNNLQRVVFHAGDDRAGGEKKHLAFWEGLLKAAQEVDALDDKRGSGCADITRKYRKTNPNLADGAAYPRLSEHRGLPHLYVAAALLMFFSNETDVALRILHEAKPKVKLADYLFLSLQSYFSYFLGRPTDEIIDPFEEIRRVSAERQRKLADYCRTVLCEKSKGSTLQRIMERERLAEIFAINSVVFYATEDIARGVNSAKGLEATAETLAIELKTIVDRNKDGLDHDTIQAYRDTYAYALVVLEAQKPSPSAQVFRQMARLLKDVVRYHEQNLAAKIRQGETPTKADYALLSVVRKHQQSAEELASQ